MDALDPVPEMDLLHIPDLIVEVMHYRIGRNQLCEGGVKSTCLVFNRYKPA